MRFVPFILVSIIMCFLVFSSCSTGARDDVLSFLFDGVNEDNNKISSQTDSLKNPGNTDTLTTKKKSVYLEANVLHAPFQGKLCGDCHNKQNGFRLANTMPELCFTCHDDFRTELPVLHGPVASGACTQCHHPHLSKNPKLLIRSGQKLCTYCHDPEYVLANDAHEDIGETNCIECHNAHGGESEYYLN